MSRISFLASLEKDCAFSGLCIEEEPLSLHTTFRIGGPAELYLKPDAYCFVPFVTTLLKKSGAESIPLLTLGGGANLLVADRGLRGITLDTGVWSGLEKAERTEGGGALVTFRAGTPTDAAVNWAAEAGLSGLEDFAGLPGTLGGAVWMNARCYESDIAGLLSSVDYLDEEQDLQTLRGGAGFAYKKSPFQGRNALILSVNLALKNAEKAAVAQKSAARRAEREAKGHFRYHSAGSVFKNNRAFGKSTGKLLEELRLCGMREGGAQIAPWHGNFIINTGGAAASDVKRLIDIAAERAFKATGFTLEREVLYVGEV